ncbi:hypothetical protein BJ742DRAFT_812613 [Cladochytrium replicatum]|nr:hypothetical protein BJ742DRAFT_812613 [Cladochytrium replicatum]
MQAAAFVCEYWEREAMKKEKKVLGRRREGLRCKISEIFRQMITGPKIVSKYIDAPALVQGRKFELQILILVDWLDPVREYYAPDPIVPVVATAIRGGIH